MIFWKYYTKFGETLLFIPILILRGFVSFNLRFLELCVILFCIQFVLGVFLKIIFFKDRPSKMNYNSLFTKILASSFPSMHSANTFLLFLLSLHFTNPVISIFYFLFWLTISYSRILLFKHFYIDILNGALLSIFVYALYVYTLNLYLIEKIY